MSPTLDYAQTAVQSSATKSSSVALASRRRVPFQNADDRFTIEECKASPFQLPSRRLYFQVVSGLHDGPLHRTSSKRVSPPESLFIRKDKSYRQPSVSAGIIHDTVALTSGTRLGPYEIVSPLGAGGMGEVYRARDTRLDRTVAIKILPPHLSEDPILRQRFEREAKAISSLNHPHICVLHDVGNQDGMQFLVMECVEGETLAKRLEKGPLPLEQALKYGMQIADALDKAHRTSVVHRDLKPGNIMLTGSGTKLLDFGLAKTALPLAAGATLTAATQPSPVTAEGTVIGTFQYMSPEQIEGKELDGRSDIFSFGA